LAAYLYRLRNLDESRAYDRIVGATRLIAPFFHDFKLEPSGSEFFLNWIDADSKQVFGPHQLSEGVLRAICLVTVLLQPEDEFPAVMVIDEPELSLHPYALNLVASLIKAASSRCPVLISTQSSRFLDHFAPSDLVVVERQAGESVFRRPDPVALEPWLEEYSLGEIWEKNVLGGGPH
jgi:predicted ATPase